MNESVVAVHTDRLPRFISSGYRFFEPGKRHVNRTMDICVLVMVLEGELYFTEDGQRGSVAAGHWRIERPGRTLRGRRPCPRLRFYYVHFTALPASEGAVGMNLTDPGTYNEPARGVMSLPIEGTFDIPHFTALFDRFEQTKTASPNDPILHQGVFLELLSALMDTARPLLDAEARLAGDVMDYLTLHFHQGLRVADLTDVFHFSPDYLSRIMRTHYGVTVKQCIQQLRLRRAMELLSHTGIPIDQVAELAGFGDATLFYRAFRARTGQTPARWRRSHR